MSEQVAIEALKLCGVFAATWCAIRVEMRWMRADIRRCEEIARDHSVRIRQLEIGD